MKLVEWRIDTDLTQAELAKRLSTSQGHISDLEKGKVVPTTATVAAIAEATGGKVAWADWVVIAIKPKARMKKVKKLPAIRRKK